MKYVFFGTPTFAAIIFEKLIAGGMPPVAVVANPDRPAGRKNIVTPPPTKVLAVSHGIPVLQPETLSGFAETLRPLGADLGIVAAYGKIIPENIIAAFPRGVIGIHPSLLPRHRGASPIQTTILQDDRETGVTIYRLDKKVDHGPVIEQKRLAGYDASRATYETLHDALALLGAELCISLLPKIERALANTNPQDEANATYTKKFTTEDGFVEWENVESAIAGGSEAALIDRKVRALNPEPGVYTLREGKRMKLLESEFIDGKLKLKTIQYEGKKPEPAR